MMSKKHQYQDWKGRAVVGDGFGVFLGVAGDSEVHRHWATQFTVGIDGLVNVETAGQWLVAEAVVIAANIPHRLAPAGLLSIYLEPGSTILERRLRLPCVLDSVACYQRLALDAGLLSVLDTLDCQKIAHWLKSGLGGFATEDNQRLRQTLRAIHRSLHDPNPLTRAHLADLAGLSPSRFSHWFSEQMSLPLKSYRKWLKLRLSVDALLAGVSPIEAAHAGGFADQAHLSRSFKADFGVTFGHAVNALSGN